MPYAAWSQLWDLIKKPPAAVAVYLTLLRICFAPGFIDESKDAVLSQLLEHGLSAEELSIAQEALEVFTELIKYEKGVKTNIEEFRKLLEFVERGNYELFKKALYSYLKRDAPVEEIRRIVQAFTTLRTYVSSEWNKTVVGSYTISSYIVSSGPSIGIPMEVEDDDYIIKDFNISMRRLKELGFFIPIDVLAPDTIYLIIPAPYTDMDIFKLFEKPEKVDVEKQVAKIEEVKVAQGIIDVKPSREVLEGIVAEALRSLGFSVQTNVRLPAKGGDIEVDVWATKNVGNAQFRVYVSCRNWDRDIDRTFVDHEFGRVLQLYQLPHLRILVVKSLTEPARKAAFDDGFFVIELGEKATTENAQEIYDIIYSKLKEIFIGITPEKIMKAIERLREAMRMLEDVI
jgi:hypothetical protein